MVYWIEFWDGLKFHRTFENLQEANDYWVERKGQIRVFKKQI